MGCDGINLCPHVGTNNFGLSLKKLEILPENMGQNHKNMGISILNIVRGTMDLGY